MRFNKVLFALTVVLSGLFLSCCNTAEEAARHEVPAPEDVMMYQINPRVFAPQNSFAAVEQRLDSIKAIGTNVVWFMPIYPVGQINSVNSPYCIRNYTDVNPEFGTLESFKSMIDACHERGMSVIIDWVANHTSWDHPWVTEHKDWYTQDEEGNIIHPANTGWLDVADLNFDNARMRLEMIDEMKFWVTEVGVDGFRCDAADYVPFDFWKQACDSLRAIPDHKLLLLAEGKRKDHFDAGFEMNYAWDFLEAVREVYVKGETAVKLIESDVEEYAGLPEGCVKLRFTTNHDEAVKMSPIDEFTNERGSMSAFVVSAFLRGGALIYGSQEVGYPDVIDFFKYVPVDWNAKPELWSEYKELMSLYNSYPALRKGEAVTYADDNVMMFEKTLDGEDFLVVANVRNTVSSVAVPESWAGASASDMMAGGKVVLDGTVELAPYQYLVLGR